jgi:hypothetical protein
MTAAGGFFVAYGNDEGSIHVKGFNGGPPGKRHPSHEKAIPLEMFRPRITTRMIQRHFVTRLRISGYLAGGLAEGAGNTGGRDIVVYGLATCGLGNDMVQVTRGFLACL